MRGRAARPAPSVSWTGAIRLRAPIIRGGARPAVRASDRSFVHAADGHRAVCMVLMALRPAVDPARAGTYLLMGAHVLGSADQARLVAALPCARSSVPLRSLLQAHRRLHSRVDAFGGGTSSCTPPVQAVTNRIGIRVSLDRPRAHMRRSARALGRLPFVG